MHETSIANSILQIAHARAEAYAQNNRQPAASVSAVDVQIGLFRNVDPESLQFAFDCLKQQFDSCAAAVLNCTVVAALADCAGAKHRYEPCLDNDFQCTVCGAGIGSLLRGDELDVIGCTVVIAGQPAGENATASEALSNA